MLDYEAFQVVALYKKELYNLKALACISIFFMLLSTSSQASFIATWATSQLVKHLITI